MQGATEHDGVELSGHVGRCKGETTFCRIGRGRFSARGVDFTQFSEMQHPEWSSATVFRSVWTVCSKVTRNEYRFAGLREAIDLPNR
jgi:hypothetical protein